MKKSIYDFNPILRSQIVLYLFLFMSVIQLFFFMNTNDFSSLIIFIMIGVLTSFFNKNMIVILCLSLAISNIIKYGVQGVRVSEGFDPEVELSKEEDEIADNSIDNLDDIPMKKLGGEKPLDGNGKKKSAETKKTADKKKPAADTKKVADTKKPAANDKKAKKTEELKNELKIEFPEFKDIQKEIIAGIDKINPLLKKAENYMNKYENFNNNKENFEETIIGKK